MSTYLTIRDILEATNGRPYGVELSTEVTGFAVDSREVTPGDVFIAIPGAHTDGHNFVRDALQHGAVCVLVHRKVDVPHVLVHDTRDALIQLATYWRDKLNPYFIIVTGSCGKTTTKDMIAEILQSSYRVAKAPKSYNSTIGFPLAILNIRREHEVAVLELETNNVSLTGRLAKMVGPDLVVVTNIGDTHLEYLGNRQGVAREKYAVVEALKSNGYLVVNLDDPILSRWYHTNRITFGTSKTADWYATDIEEVNGKVRFTINSRYNVELPFPGRFNIYNALAAIAATDVFDVSIEDRIEVLQGFNPPPRRLEVLRVNDITLINDSYNANPQSMAAALEVLRTYPGRRKIAVLGDMLELGDHTADAHKELGNLLRGINPNAVFLIGQYVSYIKQGLGDDFKGKLQIFNELNDMIRPILEYLQPGDVVLFKASLLVNLDKVVKEILARIK